MIKFFLYVLVFLLLRNDSFAQQTTPVDYKKMTEEAAKKIEALQNDPRYKAMVEQAKKMNLQPANTPAAVKPDAAKPVTLKPDRRQLPVRNAALLAQLPKKILSRNELSAYLNTLDAQLAEKIKPVPGDSVKYTIQQLGNDGEKISYAAMVAWYNNNPKDAVMLASKAAALAIDNNTALNNCAAIFIMAGLNNKAIPILQVLLQREPKSSTVLNNIGQAYTNLGDLDTAMYYFGRCIKIAPAHPEANTTATIICIKKGQMEQAKSYCTQSLKGGLTSEAIKSYGHLFIEDNIEKLIDTGPWKIYPFNEHDFTFPEQCEKIADAARIQAELDACKSKYKAFFKKYDKGYADEMRSKAATMNAQYAKDPVNNMAMINAETPYTQRSAYAYHRVSSQLLADIFDLTSKHSNKITDLKKEYEGKKKELETKRDKEYEACAGNNACTVKVMASHCHLQNELSDQYLPKFAVINRDYVSKRWRMGKELFEAFSVMLRMGIRHNTIQYYSEEAGRIGIIAEPLINGQILTAGYEVIGPYCDMTDAEMKRIDSLELKENKNCNLNVEIPLGVAKMTFSCDEYEIEGGEGLKLKFNKNFKSGQSTVYAGVGASEDIPGFEAGATQYIYVCFDKNNQPVDVGTQGELELDVKGLVKADQKIILKTSLNTGISLDPGPLQGLAELLPYAFK